MWEQHDSCFVWTKKDCPSQFHMGTLYSRSAQTPGLGMEGGTLFARRTFVVSTGWTPDRPAMSWRTDCPVSVGTYPMTGDSQNCSIHLFGCLIGKTPFLTLSRNLLSCNQPAFCVPDALWRSGDRSQTPLLFLMWYSHLALQEPNPLSRRALARPELTAPSRLGLHWCSVRSRELFSPVGLYH